MKTLGVWSLIILYFRYAGEIMISLGLFQKLELLNNSTHIYVIAPLMGITIACLILAVLGFFAFMTVGMYAFFKENNNEN